MANLEDLVRPFQLPLTPASHPPTGPSPAPQNQTDLVLAYCDLQSVPAVDPSVWEFAGDVMHVNTSDAVWAYQRFGNSTGDRPPLILVPGYGGTMHAWPTTWLQALALDQEVIIFDNRGQGLTVDLMPTAPITMEGMSQDVVDFIEALDLDEKPNLMGWSMGGMVTLTTAALRGDAINKAVVISGSPGSLASPHPQADVLSAFSGNVIKAEAFLNMSTPIVNNASREFACDHWYQLLIDEDIPVNTTTMSRQYQALLNFFTLDDLVDSNLGKITIDILMVGGDLDPVVPVEGLRRAATLIPHPWLVIYPNAAHHVAFQYADSFLPLLSTFLTFESY